MEENLSTEDEELEDEEDEEELDDEDDEEEGEEELDETSKTVKSNPVFRKMIIPNNESKLPNVKINETKKETLEEDYLKFSSEIDLNDEEIETLDDIQSSIDNIEDEKVTLDNTTSLNKETEESESLDSTNEVNIEESKEDIETIEEEFYSNNIEDKIAETEPKLILDEKESSQTSNDEEESANDEVEDESSSDEEESKEEEIEEVKQERKPNKENKVDLHEELMKIFEIPKNSEIHYYFNAQTVMKYLRNVLNNINHGYMDSGYKVALIIKRYLEKYGSDEIDKPRTVLLAILKNIGVFYMNDEIPKDSHRLAAASSYSFLRYCSPLGKSARPLLFFKAKYISEYDDINYKMGLLLSLANQIVMYNYQEYSYEEIKQLIKKDSGIKFDPEQIKLMFKLLDKQPDVFEKINGTTSLFLYEVNQFILQANFTQEELLGYINTTNFSFEFHNHETLAHTTTVAIIARALAKRLRLTEGMCAEVFLAGIIHDIGKIRVPHEILCHPDKLEGSMLKEMRNHARYTKEILEDGGSFSYKIVEIAANHHEKLDGSGYPRGLRAVDLTICDKIIAIADIASALYCKRSYKNSFDDEKIQEILLNDGKSGKLDLHIIEHFVNDYDEIMKEAKYAKNIVLDIYNAQVDSYNELKDSDELKGFFDDNDKSIDIIDQ